MNNNSYLRMTKQVTSINGDHRRPHFVLIPLMAQGHMIPMVDLGFLLAARGAVVSVITTPLNASRFRTTIDHARDAGLSIRLVELRFPCSEVGIPDGHENLDVLPPVEYTFGFFRATALLQQPVEDYIRAQTSSSSSPTSPPSCIISDFCHPWTRHVARNVGLPRLTFFSICCFTLLGFHNIWRHNVLEGVTDEHEPFAVPDVEPRVEVTKAQEPWFFQDPWLAEEVRRAESEADGILANTFEALEAAYIESYSKAMGKKVWSVGPLSLCNETIAGMMARGNVASIDTSHCLSWLDSKEPDSVVYVSFGSLARKRPAQLMEIGLGLEASGHPFVLVIKKSEMSERVEEWVGELEERVGSRGLVIRGWAPQVMILSHAAVGALVTHCGWNSTMEGVTAGVPMVTWPHFADQFLNERFVVDILRVGVSLGVRKPMNWMADDDEVVVNKEDFERAVRSVMGGGDEGREMRKRVRRLGEKAKEVMREGGSSHATLTHLIEHFGRRVDEDGEPKTNVSFLL